MGDKTAVIYARVSSTGERQSTERQVKDLSDYALYKQMDVRKVFEEHISGAKKNEERPVLCEAIDYCKEHNAGHIHYNVARRATHLPAYGMGRWVGFQPTSPSFTLPTVSLRSTAGYTDYSPVGRDDVAVRCRVMQHRCFAGKSTLCALESLFISK